MEDVRSLLRSYDATTGTAKRSSRNTGDSYKADQLDYVGYCEEKGVDPLNPSCDEWKQYSRNLIGRVTITNGKRKGQPKEGADVCRSISTLHRNLEGIGNLLVQHGVPSPTRTFSHKRFMRELAREQKRSTKKARPLDADDVRKLIASYDQGTPPGLRSCALAVIGGSRGWRASTIVGLQLENISRDPRGVVIYVLDQKTNRTSELEPTATPHTPDHQACMACIVLRLVEMFHALGINSGPLFRPINQWGQIASTALTTKSVTDLLQQGLAEAGIPDAETYSSHSYRHGVVQAAIRLGWPDEDIMTLTLHRSKRGLRPYVICADPWRFAPSRSLLDIAVPASSANDDRGWDHVQISS
jgi:integrase